MVMVYAWQHFYSFLIPCTNKLCGRLMSFLNPAGKAVSQRQTNNDLSGHCEHLWNSIRFLQKTTMAENEEVYFVLNSVV